MGKSAEVTNPSGVVNRDAEPSSPCLGSKIGAGRTQCRTVSCGGASADQFGLWATSLRHGCQAMLHILRATTTESWPHLYLADASFAFSAIETLLVKSCLVCLVASRVRGGRLFRRPEVRP